MARDVHRRGEQHHLSPLASGGASGEGCDSPSAIPLHGELENAVVREGMMKERKDGRTKDG